MPKVTGSLRRIVAGLLALGLLALPSAAMRHPAAATPAHQAADEVAFHDRDAMVDEAQSHLGTAHHQQAQHQHQPCSDAGKSGLACCVVGGCRAIAGFPSAEAPDLSSSPGRRLDYVSPVPVLHGTDLAPTPPPPRAA